jgi:hypothetical protein
VSEVLVAHVSGLPIEELAPLASGAGTLIFLRAWLRIRIRERMRG